MSAFSTNLKMHLKSHHKQEFVLVMEQEVAQLLKDGPQEATAGEEGQGKRRRRTISELRETIDKCKQSMQRDGGLKAQSPSPARRLPAAQSPAASPNPPADDLRMLMGCLQNSSDQNLVSSIVKTVQDVALSKLLNSLGSADLLHNAAFQVSSSDPVRTLQDFVFTLNPGYQLPSEARRAKAE